MSAPNEDTAMWAAFRTDKQQAARARKEANIAILRASTIPFQFRNGGDVVLVREKGYPSVDFWPSVDKWTMNGKTTHGDASALIKALWLQGPKRGKVGL